MLDAKVFAHIESVRAYRERLGVLQGVWDNLSLLSQMNGDGMNMQTTRAAFERLAGNLLQNLAAENVKKTVLAMQGKAQLAIDVMVRNLYERTADIGFLCADQDVQKFLQSRYMSAGQDADDAALKLQKPLQRRFAEYVAKYSVYDNIVLLAPDGEVLLQLTGAPAVASSSDALVKESLNTHAAYVESFRHIDLFPEQPHSLLYSFRVVVENKVLGLLCLSFRFKDECDGIFTKLLTAQDWTVLTYLDADGRVIASSDPWQIPEGAQFAAGDDQDGRLLRFAGREYLCVTRAAKSYQGYRGPGWRCCALIPLEQACNSAAAAYDTALPPAALAAVRKNEAVFSHELQQVPIQAETIQCELNRTVWNGHIRIGNRGDTGNSFSKILLWEISNTGRKTQEVFEHSIASLERTVVSAILQDTQSMAALAVDILDRNLYERANDCRWWALDRRLCRYLSQPEDPAEINRVLQHINQLYTVYHTLVLFDAQARVVAVSNSSCESWVGQTLDESWAQKTLSLSGSQAYHVSPFEPNRFYEDQPTLTYSAALRAGGRIIGGIGIVFDAAPQLQAMLSDALTRKDGSIALYVGKDGRVLSATDRYVPGESIPLDPEFFSPPAEGLTRIVAIADTYYAIGAQAASGYREYPGLDVVSLMMIPLGAVDVRSQTFVDTPSPLSARRAQNSERTVELATFRAGGHWLAVPLAQVIEAIDASGLHALPEKVHGQAGYIMHEDKAILVADLAALLEGERHHAQREIVLVRALGGKTLGLLVETLGEIPQVDAGDIIPSIDMFAARSLTESMVRSAKTEEPLLLILNPDRVAERLSLPRPVSNETLKISSG